MRVAFTLIELLVVITIIVVLLALLTPAMDKAIYQAELVGCAGKLDAVGAAVSTYALGHRRSYPFRDLPPTRTGVGNPQYVTPTELVRPVNTFDMRPGLRDVLSINSMLQCPLTDATLELEQTPVDEWVHASYTMWWGWLYHEESPALEAQKERQAGMFKLGDRWAWQGKRYNVLAGDYDLYAGAAIVQGSHPDDKGVMSLLTYRRVPTFGVPLTVSAWYSQSSADRGLVDLNFALTDGSVQRVVGVKRYRSGSDHDERMGAVPNSWRNVEKFKRYQVPK